MNKGVVTLQPAASASLPSWVISDSDKCALVSETGNESSFGETVKKKKEKKEKKTQYVFLSSAARVSAPVVAPLDAVKEDVNELLSHVGWCLWGSSRDSLHVLCLFAVWRLWCAGWLQRVARGQTGGNQLRTGGGVPAAAPLSLPEQRVDFSPSPRVLLSPRRTLVCEKDLSRGKRAHANSCVSLRTHAWGGSFVRGTHSPLLHAAAASWVVSE